MATSLAETGPARAGEIGPVRREITFEPVHEQPVPVDPAPSQPAPSEPVREPVPEPA